MTKYEAQKLCRQLSDKIFGTSPWSYHMNLQIEMSPYIRAHISPDFGPKSRYNGIITVSQGALKALTPEQVKMILIEQFEGINYSRKHIMGSFGLIFAINSVLYLIWLVALIVSLITDGAAYTGIIYDCFGPIMAITLYSGVKIITGPAKKCGDIAVTHIFGKEKVIGLLKAIERSRTQQVNDEKNAIAHTKSGKQYLAAFEHQIVLGYLYVNEFLQSRHLLIRWSLPERIEFVDRL